MITIRKSKDRGHFDHGWLNTYHTFSFDQYRNPQHMSFRQLRVINQDIVQPRQGFGSHEHHNMEILTYVLRGEVTHKDSMGNEGVIKPGEIQRMSAGTGVTHSEFNQSDQELELLQIWIFPAQKNLAPSYQQLKYTIPHNQLILIASPTPEKNAVIVHQDVKLFTGQLNANKSLTVDITPNRYAWLQLINGELSVNNNNLNTGDGVAISDEMKLNLVAKQTSSFLLFDLN
jgi:quercetin 2,3-dioxygenase